MRWTGSPKGEEAGAAEQFQAAGAEIYAENVISLISFCDLGRFCDGFYGQLLEALIVPERIEHRIETE